jgi:hypothetical protein
VTLFAYATRNSQNPTLLYSDDPARTLDPGTQRLYLKCAEKKAEPATSFERRASMAGAAAFIFPSSTMFRI